MTPAAARIVALALGLAAVASTARFGLAVYCKAHEPDRSIESLKLRPGTENPPLPSEPTTCSPCEQNRKAALPLRSAALASAVVGMASPFSFHYRCQTEGYWWIDTQEPASGMSYDWGNYDPITGTVPLNGHSFIHMPCLILSSDPADCKWCYYAVLTRWYPTIGWDTANTVTTPWRVETAACDQSGNTEYFYVTFPINPADINGKYKIEMYIYECPDDATDCEDMIFYNPIISVSTVIN